MADPSPDDDVDDGKKPTDDEGQEPAGEVKPDDGQEPAHGKTYTESYVRALRREASGYRNRLGEVEERLQEFVDRDKTEAEKASEHVAELEARAVTAEAALIRYEVAAERGLDGQAAALLVGTSRDEVEASAEKLTALLADRTKAPPSFDGGARQPAEKQQSPEAAHNDFLLEALGRNPSKS